MKYSMYGIFTLFIVLGLFVVIGFSQTLQDKNLNIESGRYESSPADIVAPKTHTKQTDLATKIVNIRKHKFILEIADTEALRALGLGGRKQNGPFDGMIFIFDTPALYGFWMKDTLIPLDMIWIDKNFNIVSKKEAVLPETFPKVFYPTKEALYVIEFSSGTLKKRSIDIGDKISFVE